MKKKVAILLTGQLRTFDDDNVIKSWNKFIQKYDIDVFGCFWENR